MSITQIKHEKRRKNFMSSGERRGKKLKFFLSINAECGKEEAWKEFNSFLYKSCEKTHIEQ